MLFGVSICSSDNSDTISEDGHVAEEEFEEDEFIEIYTSSLEKIVSDQPHDGKHLYITLPCVGFCAIFGGEVAGYQWRSPWGPQQHSGDGLSC